MKEMQQAARQAIRTNLQRFVCERMNERYPDSFWSNALWLAEGFERDAREQWRELVCKREDVPLKQIVPDALSGAVENATLPYEAAADVDELADLVRQYVEKFDYHKVLG